MDLKGKHVEIYFTHDVPKLAGVVTEEGSTGLFVNTGDDGTNLQFKVLETFVPYHSIKRADIMIARSPEEQEAKKHDLAERFRKMAIEATAPSTGIAEILANQLP